MSSMKRLRLADVFSLPGLLSLVRAPLAVAFPFALHSPVAAMAVLFAAALSDVLDGWCARRVGKETVTGAILDPVMDKLFVATVAVTLLATGQLSPLLALLVATRDILELPLAVWVAVDAPKFAERRARVKANVFGKIVTVLQFGTVTAVLVARQYVNAFALASATVGVVAAATYWARMLRDPA